MLPTFSPEDLPRLDPVAERPLEVREHEPLAPLTTFELGGPARYFADIHSPGALAQAMRFATERDLRMAVLGGGSNLLVSDAGFAGLVLHIHLRGKADREASAADGQPVVLVTAGAGERFDELVAWTVERGLQGLECLAGIPGLVGATPVQNVGAYGQEVSDSIAAVEVFDREGGERRVLTPADCSFAYRDSALKRRPERFIVTAVTFALRPDSEPVIRYAELHKALAADGERPTVSAAHACVLRLRRSKSMTVDPQDPNRRSAGSFFTNPILPVHVADEVVSRALSAGIVKKPDEVPRWAQPDGRVKLAAGWLIEKAGLRRGLRRGPVGLSSAHALALVHHGGGSTAELLKLAEHVVDTVEARFGVRLEREPVLLG
ncbi:MAG: UDP-N-acetylmuramate dehydrogenase [Deltaproteobacteria bacterium]|nr:UDP-N-acetylmuramate dehydrogenase [Deltaproteobacteria bacterium]